MARRSDHTREELKGLILEAAWRIVEEEGMNAVTARSIAKAVGYTPGTIYNLFDSMGGIYLHLNARTLDLLYAALDASTGDGDMSASGKIKAMANGYMHFAREYRPQWQMLFNLSVTDGREDVEWYHQKVERIFEPLEVLVKPYFSAGQEQESRAAARTLWAAVHGLCFLQEVEKLSLIHNEKSADAMVDYLVDTFIAGMQK